MPCSSVIRSQKRKSHRQQCMNFHMSHFSLCYAKQPAERGRFEQSSLEKKKVIATKIPITKQSIRNSAVHFQRATPYFTSSSAFFSTWRFWKSSFNSFLQTSTGCQALILIWTESIILYFPLSMISQPTPVEWKNLLMMRETLRSQAGK